MLNIFLIFLRLGLTSFGGPIAHLGYFYNEFVKKRNWLSEETYSELLALCQFLPGPASSQMGIAIGLNQAGPLGALLAWLGFTLPSAVFLYFCAVTLQDMHGPEVQNIIHGFKLFAIPIVAQAIVGMWKKLCPDNKRKYLALISTIILMLVKFQNIQLILILLGALIGFLFIKQTSSQFVSLANNPAPNKNTSLLMIFLLLAIVLVSILNLSSLPLSVNLFTHMFRIGTFVFGGGHVVLPLLQEEVLKNSWLNSEQFLTGYGLTQIVPGPLFTIVAFVGASMPQKINPVIGSTVCIVGIFLPSFLMIFAAVPFWKNIRQNQMASSAVAGINATVVGLLIAAFINPICLQTIASIADGIIVVVIFFLLEFKKMRPWLAALITLILSVLSKNLFFNLI